LLEESQQRAEFVRDAGDLHPHLTACSDCRKQFEAAALDRQLRNMRPAKSEVRQTDCPDPAVWREIAGGATPIEETLVRIQHASRCDYCGPLLREALAELAVLNGELTPEEKARIASLESAHEKWQKRLAQKIAGIAHAKPRRDSSSWVWLFWKPAPWQRIGVPSLAAAAVFLLAAVAGGARFLSQRHQPATA